MCLKSALIVAMLLCLTPVECPARAQSRTTPSAEAVTLNNRGLELYREGKSEDAIAMFRQALASKPEFVEALDNLGLALDASGKNDEAIAVFERALKLKPADAITESNLGFALYHQKSMRRRRLPIKSRSR